MNAPQKKEEDHAYQNAQSWASSITEMVAALECDYDRLQELRDEREALEDVVKERSALAVEIAADEGQDEDAKRTHAEAYSKAVVELEQWVRDNADELADLTAAATIDGDVCENDEQARERIQEAPLSVEIRSGWTAPGDVMEAEDFCILLSTGGPALRIRGELSEHNEPRRAWLEYQDWGTPWTEYHGEGCEHGDLLTFCQQFYFGE